MPKLVGCACGQELTVRDELIGKRVRCPRCGQTLDVPAGGADGVDEIDEIAASLRVPESAARPPASEPGRGEPPPGYWGVPQGRTATAPGSPPRPTPSRPESARSEPAMAGAGAVGETPVPSSFGVAVLSSLGLSLVSLVLLAGVMFAFASRHAGWQLGR